ncbi:hypothetical protein QP431_08275 [Actinotignum sanguinis]|uniref:hypothetical protein n=1 Tax=Actinotignum sanguinis TaxID=1445614 RepID=UPI0025502518|nr:hypothetical protein [Actinotignum sanguinis]MDK7198196.1 hypothetical protein [Actinotignum sanguinis]
MRGSAFSDDDGARGWFKRRRQRKRAQDLADWQTRTHRSAFSESPPRAGAGSAFSEPENERRPAVARAKEGARGGAGGRVNAGSRGKERSRTRQGSRTKPHPRDERAMRQAYASSAQLLPTVPPVPYPASAGAQQAGGATGPYGAAHTTGARVNTAPPPEAPKKKKDRGLFWWLIIVFVCFPAGFFLADMEDEVSDPPAEVGSAQSAEDSGDAGGAANAAAPEAGTQPLATYAPVPQNLAETQAVRTESHIPAFLNQPFVIPAGYVFGGYHMDADATNFYDTETGQLRYSLPGELTCTQAGDTANMWCTPSYWGNPFASAYISDTPATLRAAADGAVIWQSGEDAQGFAPGVLLSQAGGREDRFSWLSPTDGAVLHEITRPASFGSYHVTPGGEVLIFDIQKNSTYLTVLSPTGQERGALIIEGTDLSTASVVNTTDGWFVPEFNISITNEGKFSRGTAFQDRVRAKAPACLAPQASTTQLRTNLETLLADAPRSLTGSYYVGLSACTPGGLAYLVSSSAPDTTVVTNGQVRKLPLSSVSWDFLPLGNGAVLTGYQANSRDATFAFDWNQGEAPVWSVPATMTDAVPGYGLVGTDYSTPDSERTYYALRAK